MLKAVLLVAALAAVALASSHSEAPNTARAPQSDGVDLYAFRAYEPGREDYTVLIMNVQPLQNPFGGPNYFSLDDNAFYEIYIDNDGDAIEDITFQFYYGNKLGGALVSTDDLPDDDDCRGEQFFGEMRHGGLTVQVGGRDVYVPLKFIGPVTATNQDFLNWFEWYQINYIVGDRTTGQSTRIHKAGDSSFVRFTKPFDYAGQKSFPDYDAYASQYIYSIDIPNCDVDGRVFVGQRHEPFYINLGEIFDLINFVPVAGFPGAIQESNCNNDLRSVNVDSFVLEVPTKCLLGTSDVFGVWTATRRLRHDGSGGHIPGKQISRLGNPLVNELVIGLRDKAKFNGAEPKDDALPPNEFQNYVLYPTLPALLNILFKDAVNSVLDTDFPDIAPNVDPATGRQDLFLAFLTGVPGLNMLPNGVPAEMMRLNTTIPITPRGSQNSLGVIGGDNAGFPNGRRPGDDAVDIALDVMMGRLCTLNIGCAPGDAPVGDASFTDGAPVKDTDFRNAFPYLNTPVRGSPHVVDNCASNSPIPAPPSPCDCEPCRLCPSFSPVSPNSPFSAPSLSCDDDDDSSRSSSSSSSGSTSLLPSALVACVAVLFSVLFF